jgi:hypothetical protein
MTGLDNRGPGTLDIRGKAPVDPRFPRAVP